MYKSRLSKGMFLILAVTICIPYYTVPSSPPVRLSVIPLTPQDLLVSWQAPPRELQNGLIRSYTIQLLTVATGILTLRNSSSLNVTIKSLHPHYEYEISVAASTVGLGPYSTEITVIMPESGHYLILKALQVPCSAI